MILYDYVLSPSCYKIRLLAALTGAPLTLRAVDVHPGAEQRGPALLALNPAGTVPILTDGTLILTETASMLVYLAAGFAPDWLGGDTPEARARVQQWLAFAHRLTASLGRARAHDMLVQPGDIDALRAEGTRALREREAALVEQRLRSAGFLAAD